MPTRKSRTTIEETIITAIIQLLEEKPLALKTQLIWPRVKQLLSKDNRIRLRRIAEFMDLSPEILVEDWVFRNIRRIQDKVHKTFTTDDKNTAATLRVIHVSESNINWLW